LKTEKKRKDDSNLGKDWKLSSKERKIAQTKSGQLKEGERGEKLREGHKLRQTKNRFQGVSSLDLKRKSNKKTQTKKKNGRGRKRKGEYGKKENERKGKGPLKRWLGKQAPGQKKNVTAPPPGTAGTADGGGLPTWGNPP